MKRHNQRLALLICAGLIGITTLLPYSGNVYAHKVNMFAYSDGPNVFIEGYFSDGHKAQNSTVTVYDPDGNQLLQGTTDTKGQFSFPIPKKKDLRIVLNAGMGHRTEYVVKASELSADSIKSTSQNEVISNSSEMVMSQSTNESSSTIADSFSNDELSKIIERSVGQAIKPLMREVSEMKEERGFASIIGGIGFIFGILGVGFYLKARKGIVQQAKQAE